MANTLQFDIKNNTNALQETIREMEAWEKSIKEEDNKLIKSQKTDNNCYKKDLLLQDIPPVRNQNKKELKKIENSSINKTKPLKKRISSYDYDAWEKYTKKFSDNESSDDNSHDEIEPTKQESLESNKDKANRLKEEGNGCYSTGKLKDAVAKYTQGLALDSSNKLLYANRAMTYIKLNEFNAAENDCSQCLKLDPKYIKAYLRRGTARYHLKKFSNAIEDYKKVLELEPWNKNAKRELEQVKIIQYKEGNKASTIKESCNNGSENHEMKQLLQTKEKLTSDKLLELENQTEDTSFLSTALKMPVAAPIPMAPKDDHKSSLEMSKSMPKKSPDLSPMKLPEIVKPTEAPAPPKNSRQFEIDWEKVSRYPDLAQTYLESIPETFYSGIEVDVDQLMQIINHLKKETSDKDFATRLLTALEGTWGFHLNLAFLEQTQKQDVRDFISGLIADGKSNETIDKIYHKL